VTPENKFPIYHRFYGLFDHNREWKDFTGMNKTGKVGERDSDCSLILVALFKNRTKHCKKRGITSALNPGAS
jgi:hypothetical protein